MDDAQRGLQIRRLREQRHLTQSEVAQRVGVGLRRYQDWEAGADMRKSNLRKLAEAFEVDTAAITGQHVPEDDLRAILERIENKIDKLSCEQRAA